MITASPMSEPITNSRPLPKKARKKTFHIFLSFFSSPLIRGGYTKKIWNAFFWPSSGAGLGCMSALRARCHGAATTKKVF
jgi:hypothetical protein